MASHFKQRLGQQQMANWSACRNRRLFHTSNIYNDDKKKKRKKEKAIKRNTTKVN